MKPNDTPDIIADLIETVGLRDTLSAIASHCSRRCWSLRDNEPNREAEANEWERAIPILDTLADGLDI